MTSFDAFLDRVTSDGSGAARGFDLPAVLEQWRGVVPPERSHVVTVPRPGSAHRTARRGSATSSGSTPARSTTRRSSDNRSLGLTQAELLRRVNLALGERLPHARAGYRGPGKASWPRPS